SGYAPSGFIAAPVPLFDFLNLVLAQTKVMADLMDQCFANRHDEIVFVGGVALERPLEEQNPVGEGVAVAPLTFRERSSLIQTEESIRRLNLHFFEQVRRRLVFDDDGQVRQRVPKSTRD